MLESAKSPLIWKRLLVLLLAEAIVVSGGALAKPPEGKGGGNGGSGTGDGGDALANPALVFAAEGNHSGDLFISTADGSAEVQLTNDDLDDAWPVWSPDGQQIAFLRERPNDSGADLYLINADGTGLRLLKDFVADGEETRPIIDSVASIDFSPDGTMIVLNGLYVLDVATGQGDYLLGEPAPASGWQPAWSPDGTTIVFSSFVEDPVTHEGDFDLFAVDLATLQVANLTPYAGDQTSPAWSPDGSSIAFVENGQLLVLTLDGEQPDVVVNDPGIWLTHESRPTWSPDGTNITFAAVRPLRSSVDYDLFRVSPASTGLTNLTGTKRRWEFEAYWNPAWK